MDRCLQLKQKIGAGLYRNNSKKNKNSKYINNNNTHNNNHTQLLCKLHQPKTHIRLNSQPHIQSLIAIQNAISDLYRFVFAYVYTCLQAEKFIDVVQDKVNWFFSFWANKQSSCFHNFS